MILNLYFCFETILTDNLFFRILYTGEVQIQNWRWKLFFPNLTFFTFKIKFIAFRFIYRAAISSFEYIASKRFCRPCSKEERLFRGMEVTEIELNF